MSKLVLHNWPDYSLPEPLLIVCFLRTQNISFCPLGNDICFSGVSSCFLPTPSTKNSFQILKMLLAISAAY